MTLLPQARTGLPVIACTPVWLVIVLHQLSMFRMVVSQRLQCELKYVARNLANIVMAALNSERGERMLLIFENALLQRRNDVVASSASFATFSFRKERLCSEFHIIRSTELKKI